MKRYFWILFSFVLLITHHGYGNVELEGEWELLGSSRKEASGSEKGLVWKMKDGNIEFSPSSPPAFRNTKYSGRYSVDTSSTPMRIDYYQDKFIDGKLLRTKHKKGIIRFDVLIMIIKFSKDTDTYPTEFIPGNTEAEQLLYFKRKTEQAGGDNGKSLEVCCLSVFSLFIINPVLYGVSAVSHF